MNQQHPAEDCPVQTTPTEPSILKRPSRRGTGFHSAANIFTVRGSADRAARYLFHNCVVHHSAAIPGSAVAWVVFGVLPDPRVERGGMSLADGRRGTGKGRTGRRSEAAYLLVCSVVVPQEGRWGWAGRTSDADLAGTAGGNFWNWAGPRDATLPRGRTPGASSTRSPEGHCVSLYPPAGPALLWRGPAASLRRGVAAT